MTPLPTIHKAKPEGGLSMGCFTHGENAPLTTVGLLQESRRNNLESSAHWRCQASAAHLVGDVGLLVFAQEMAVQFDEWAQQDDASIKRLSGGAQ